MTRVRVRRLGTTDLHRLPETCPLCPLGAGHQPGLDPGGNGAATWARAAETDWGFCGLGIVQQDRVVAYLLLASPLHVPRVGPQSGFGLNPDAAVVMSVRVLEQYARLGLGRQLVQAAAARMVRTPFQALETRSTTGRSGCAIPPPGFLEAVGFTVIDPHPLDPRYRLDLSRTVRWVPDLRPAFDRVLDWVRPLPPEPAGRAHQGPSGGLGSST
ncbi:GNAT family N-acetyltransferase [Granulicoccus sp. GXG6511]|uniref:GNAT family N-acetyltransferase n=1 Tax=Granulicoccus sp. GXG6511 TaxID=3381351 RepID=UPI003D7EF012